MTSARTAEPAPPPNPFPTQASLAQLAAAQVPARLFDDRGKDVPTWELTGPLPDALDQGPHQDGSPWGQMLADLPASRAGAVTTSEAMHCVARENAAFFLENSSVPAEALQRFIAGRCGAASSHMGSAFQAVQGDERAPDAAAVDALRPRVKELLAKMTPAGKVDMGIAYLRKKGRAVVAIVQQPQTVRVDRTPLVPDASGKVVLRGELLVPAASLRALVNRGRYGFEACEADPEVPLPRFALTCAASKDDEAAWLTVSAIPPGRILGTPVMDLLLWPAGTPGKAYVKLGRAAGGAAAKGSSASAADLVAEINRVRQEAKLLPLRLAEKESVTAGRLAPHFFASLQGHGDETTADQVALGLRAGWEIDGMVRHANVVSTMVPDAASWDDVIHAALARPFGRETLLDPAAERVAIGTVTSENVLGALFSTYALFDGYRHDDDARTVAHRLATLRAARRAPAPTVMAELNAEADRAARSVQSGARTPGAALDDLLAAASARLGRGVRGWVGETTSLEQMKFPDAALASPSMTVGIGVAHHRRPGYAWGTFLVFFVMVDDRVAGPNTASIGGPGAG